MEQFFSDQAQKYVIVSCIFFGRRNGDVKGSRRDEGQRNDNGYIIRIKS